MRLMYLDISIGDKVRAYVEEPEYCNKHGQLGVVEDLTSRSATVRYPDGLVCYFHPFELKREEILDGN